MHGRNCNMFSSLNVCINFCSFTNFAIKPIELEHNMSYNFLKVGLSPELQELNRIRPML